MRLEKQYNEFDIRENFPRQKNLLSEKIFQVGKIISKICCRRKFRSWKNSIRNLEFEKIFEVQKHVSIVSEKIFQAKKIVLKI